MNLLPARPNGNISGLGKYIHVGIVPVIRLLSRRSTPGALLPSGTVWPRDAAVNSCNQSGIVPVSWFPCKSLHCESRSGSGGSRVNTERARAQEGQRRGVGAGGDAQTDQLREACQCGGNRATQLVETQGKNSEAGQTAQCCWDGAGQRVAVQGPASERARVGSRGAVCNRLQALVVVSGTHRVVTRPPTNGVHVTPCHVHTEAGVLLAVSGQVDIRGSWMAWPPHAFHASVSAPQSAALSAGSQPPARAGASPLALRTHTRSKRTRYRTPLAETIAPEVAGRRAQGARARTAARAGRPAAPARLQLAARSVPG